MAPSVLFLLTANTPRHHILRYVFIASLSMTAQLSFLISFRPLTLPYVGDWAGNSYASSGCPGTCSDHIMDPANFVVSSTLFLSNSVVVIILVRTPPGVSTP